MSHVATVSRLTTRKVFAAVLAALLTATMLVIVPSFVGDANAVTNHTFEYVLVFQNGQTVTSPPGGTTDGNGNNVWVPNTGGTDPDDPDDGMLVHASCSDTFNLGLDPADPDYGYSDAGAQPSNPEDSGWRVADYAFRRVGTNGGQCGNQDLFDHSTLTLVKTVINDGGGTLGPDDFPAFIDGEAADWQVAYTLEPGDYTASETPQADYTAGDWGGDCADDGTVTLGENEHLTCTITNTYVPPEPEPATLTLVKTVINDGGGSLGPDDFPVFIDQDEVAWETTYELEPGTYVASETPQGDYTPSDWGGDCDANGSVTLAEGDEFTCTITNTYVPPLTPAIDIEKATNGEDADDPTGPAIDVGDPVVWTYVVTNTGEVDLSNIVVTDDQGVIPVYKSGDTGDDNILSVGEVWTYEAEGVAEVGQYANVGEVTGDHDDGEVSDTDPSHYVGVLVLASGIIGDTVWYDCATDDETDPGCDDGVQGAGELGIQGAKVTLTGLDGQDVDPVTGGTQTTLSKFTNADGKYLFSGLPEGNYKVQVLIGDVPDPEALGRALRFTTASSFTLFLPDGGEDLDNDFGVIADTLPETGADTANLMLVSLFLLLVGTTAVVAGRRFEGTTKA